MEPTNLHPTDLVASFKGVPTISKACVDGFENWTLSQCQANLAACIPPCHSLNRGRNLGARSLMCHLLVLAYKLTFIFLFLAQWCIFTTPLSLSLESLHLSTLSSHLPVSCSGYKDCLLANKI